MEKKININLIYPAIVIIIVSIYALLSYKYAIENSDPLVEEFSDSKYSVEYNYSSKDIQINTITDKETNEEYIVVVNKNGVAITPKKEVVSEDPQEK